MMDIDMNKEHWEHGKCPKYDCRKDACKCGLRKVFLASVLGDDSKDNPIAPKNGAYCDAIVVYEANGHIYIYSKEGIPTLVNSGSGGDYEELQSEIEKEISDRIAADKVLQGEIDEIKNSPDVVDIVATYAALQAYDTSKLGNNDVIRVLADETHDGQSTYYRWNKQNSTWTYIGAVGDYYTKGQVDTLLADKQDTLTAGANVQISPENVISATDTTYTHFTGATSSADGTAGLVPAPVAGDDTKFLSGDGTWQTVSPYTLPIATTTTLGGIVVGSNLTIDPNTGVLNATDTTYSAFVGTDGQTAGTAGLVPAPVTTDAGKFLKSDGTWDTAGGGSITPVQTTGTSTTDVMSQDATTKMINPDITNYPYKVIINSGTIASNTGLVINGQINNAQSNSSIAINAGSTTPAVIGGSAGNGYAAESIAIGPAANIAKGYASIAIGSNAYVATSNVYLSGIAIGASSNCGGNESLAIGDSARANSQNDVALGKSSNTLGTYSTALGSNARARSERSVAIGAGAEVENSPAMAYSVALGAGAVTSRAGEVNVGTGSNNYGYNSTKYRVIGGVHDGQDIHDAATVAQGNTLSTSAPDSSTVGVLGQLWTDTTNMHTYQCTAISGSTYTWTQRW